MNHLWFIEAKNNATQAKTELEQAKLKISHLEKELKEKEPQAQKAQKDGRELLSSLESAKKTAQDLNVWKYWKFSLSAL